MTLLSSLLRSASTLTSKSTINAKRKNIFITTKAKIKCYKNGKLEKRGNIKQLLPYYSIFNQQFVYVNSQNELVASDLETDLTASKVLLPSMDLPISMPHIVNQQIAFMAGHLFNYALHKLTNNRFDKIPLAGFVPIQLASHENSLVFTSRQKGINQIYKQKSNGEVIQLSNFKRDAIINRIDVLCDLFAISYLNRVEFYYLKSGKLKFTNKLNSYTNCVLAPSGITMLVSKVEAGKNQLTTEIVELQLKDFEPTGFFLPEVDIAFYREHAVIYINKQQQLVHDLNAKQTVLDSDVDVTSISDFAQTEDKLFYIAKDAQQLMAYEFSTGTVSKVESPGLQPTRITTINEQLYIRTQESIPPKLMIGKLVENDKQ